MGRARHASCVNSEGKAVKPTNLKLAAKCEFLQAPSNLKFRLAGSRGDSRTGGLTLTMPNFTNHVKRESGFDNANIHNSCTAGNLSILQSEPSLTIACTACWSRRRHEVDVLKKKITFVMFINRRG